MIYGLSIRNFTILVCVIFILSLFFYGILKVLNYWIKFTFFSILIIHFLIIHYLFKIDFILILFYCILPSLVLGLFIYLFNIPKKIDETWDVILPSNKKDSIIKNIKRGVLIVASAGSGKTESPIYYIMKHLAEKLFCGVIYDYKDGELTEIAKPLFKERLKVISFHNVKNSYRINPIHPSYLEDEKAVNEIAKVILDNLNGKKEGGGSDFFGQSAESLLSAVILKFKLDLPQYCTLPHIISFILAVDFSEEKENALENLGEEAHDAFGKLKTFLLSNKRVAIQASPFIMGLGSERQTASVLSTLTNALRQLAFPDSFWILSGNDLFLDLNSKDNNIVLSVVNEPKNDNFLSPLVATLIHVVTKQMMVRNRLPSFILLDEAPTIRLLNMARIPATMRSFGVATIYCLQDVVQGTVQYGEKGFKEITANLGTQIFGKSNDPDTAKFYERFFELKKEKQKSINQKGGGGDLFSTENSSTISEREVSKHRADEFMKMKAGDFAMISDGESSMFKFRRANIIREKLDQITIISEEEILENYMKIIEEANTVLEEETEEIQEILIEEYVTENLEEEIIIEEEELESFKNNMDYEI